MTMIQNTKDIWCRVCKRVHKEGEWLIRWDNSWVTIDGKLMNEGNCNKSQLLPVESFGRIYS